MVNRIYSIPVQFHYDYITLQNVWSFLWHFQFVFILKFSMYPACTQKNHIRMKNKGKGFAECRKEHPLKCLSSYFWSSFSPPFGLQPEGTWFSLCCVQYLHLAAVNLQWHFFENGQGIRSTERCWPDSARAVVFLCIWLCCYTVKQDCTQIIVLLYILSSEL